MQPIGENSRNAVRASNGKHRANRHTADIGCSPAGARRCPGTAKLKQRRQTKSKKENETLLILFLFLCSAFVRTRPGVAGRFGRLRV
jgi:hypothetical protein